MWGVIGTIIGTLFGWIFNQYSKSGEIKSITLTFFIEAEKEVKFNENQELKFIYRNHKNKHKSQSIDFKNAQ